MNVAKKLGHTNIKMAMRYAHCAPNNLEEALKLKLLNYYGEKDDKK